MIRWSAMRGIAVSATLALALLVGCKPSSKCGPIGDLSQPIELSMPLYTDGTSHQVVAVASGDKVALEPPPQSGYVLFVGVKARNLDGCGVSLKGELFDPASGASVSADTRTSDFIVGSDGWGMPNPIDYRDFANIALCPDQSTKDVHNGNYNLKLTVTDRAGRSQSLTVPIVPSCDLGADMVRSDCICNCTANFYLGKCVPGAVDASAAGDASKPSDASSTD